MTDLTAGIIIGLRDELPVIRVRKIQVTTMAGREVYIFDHTAFVHPAQLAEVGIRPGAAMHRGVPVRYDLDSTRLLERSGHYVDTEAGTWLVQL